MSNSFTWKVTKLNLEKVNGHVTDGFCNGAEYRVTADDSTCQASAYIRVDFERPDTLVPFEDLTEEIVIGWAKDMLAGI